MDPFYYIEKCFSLTKESYFEPWKMIFQHPLDAQAKMEVYLEDKYNAPGTIVNDIRVVGLGENFSYIIRQLFSRIASYPYEWPLEGQKIDPNGYDFYTDESTIERMSAIEIVASAKTIVWEKCHIASPLPELETPVTQLEYVEGIFPTKIQLTLGKASPVSTISFNLHTTKPMTLASLVYESDISHYAVPKKINLDHLQLQAEFDSITLRLSRPVFARRFTMVFIQNNAEQNAYLMSPAQAESILYQQAPTLSPDYNTIASLWQDTPTVAGSITHADFSKKVKGDN